MTPTEDRIATIFAEILGLEFVEAEDDLFSLGGDSMDGVQIQLEIEREFEIKLPVEEFRESESVARIAAWIDATKRGEPISQAE